MREHLVRRFTDLHERGRSADLEGWRREALLEAATDEETAEMSRRIGIDLPTDHERVRDAEAVISEALDRAAEEHPRSPRARRTRAKAGEWGWLSTQQLRGGNR